MTRTGPVLTVQNAGRLETLRRGELWLSPSVMGVDSPGDLATLQILIQPEGPHC